MDEQVNPLERDHSLCVVLPGGLEKSATVHGSKPVMDLLVTLCASYHLNPSDYTVEVLSPNKNNISFKPNCPVGLLEADKIVLKPKGVEEKTRKPYMPEATVRLLVNYNKSHKTVVRVNPRLPLDMLLPLVCDKCEFQVETTVLLKDCQSKEPLDLSKTLNEHGLREVFARDLNKQQPNKDEAPEVISPPPLQALPKREKQKENSGFFSLFRRRKKKQDVDKAVSAPGLGEQVDVSVDSEGASSLPAEMPKKRRAPPPPMGASQSVPNNLSSCHLTGAQRSADSTLRSTKRRAPPPPCAPSLQELQPHSAVKASVNSLNSAGELRQSDESDSVNSSLSSSPSPRPSQPPSAFSRPSLAHLQEAADPYLPSFRGKDLSDARSALAKVLTSSVSKGTLVRRLKNSATFPKFQNGSPFLSMRSSDNGGLHAELQSVLNSNLPTQGEWEDPVQRRGLTTFKVVPPQRFQDPDETLDVPDQCQTSAEDTPESEACPEAEEETCPPDGQSSTPSPRPQPAPPEIQVSPPPLQDLDSANTPQSKDASETHQDSDSPSRPQSKDASETHQDSDSPSRPQSEDASETHQDSPSRPQSEDASETHQDSDSANTPQSEDASETYQDSPSRPQSEGEDTTEKLEEEEDPDVVLPVPPDEDFTSEGHISPDQRGTLQSSSPTPGESSSGSEEKKVEEDVQEELQGEEEDEEEVSFPPPPPPVFFDEDTEVMDEEAGGDPPQEIHREDSASAEPEQPVEKKSAAPSRFAQAVAMAVQRSRLQGRSKGSSPQVSGGPCGSLQSPPRSTYQYGA